MDETLKWVLTILCVIAVIAILIWRLSPIIFFNKRAIHTKGTIVNWMSARVKGTLIFKPIIKYLDEKGNEVSYASDDSCENEPEYPIGTEVEVRYDPKDSRFVRITYPDKA